MLHLPTHVRIFFVRSSAFANRREGEPRSSSMARKGSISVIVCNAHTRRLQLESGVLSPPNLLNGLGGQLLGHCFVLQRGLDAGGGIRISPIGEHVEGPVPVLVRPA